LQQQSQLKPLTIIGAPYGKPIEKADAPARYLTFAAEQDGGGG
jgi:hypothetical protein